LWPFTLAFRNPGFIRALLPFFLFGQFYQNKNLSSVFWVVFDILAIKRDFGKKIQI